MLCFPFSPFGRRCFGWCCFPILLWGGAPGRCCLLLHFLGGGAFLSAFLWVVVLSPSLSPLLGGASWAPPSFGGAAFRWCCFPASHILGGAALGGVAVPFSPCGWCCFLPSSFRVVLLSPSPLVGCAAFPSSSFLVVLPSSVSFGWCCRFLLVSKWNTIVFDKWHYIECTQNKVD